MCHSTVMWAVIIIKFMFCLMVYTTYNTVKSLQADRILIETRSLGNGELFMVLTCRVHNGCLVCFRELTETDPESWCWIWSLNFHCEFWHHHSDTAVLKSDCSRDILSSHQGKEEMEAQVSGFMKQFNQISSDGIQWMACAGVCWSLWSQSIWVRLSLLITSRVLFSRLCED